MYIYIHIHIHICINIHTDIYIDRFYIRTYVRTYVRTYMHTYIYTYILWLEPCLVTWCCIMHLEDGCRHVSVSSTVLLETCPCPGREAVQRWDELCLTPRRSGSSCTLRTKAVEGFLFDHMVNRCVSCRLLLRFSEHTC